MVQSQVLCGDWYLPDGTRVGFGGGTRFLVNRGPKIIYGQQFNGSVRLFLQIQSCIRTRSF